MNAFQTNSHTFIKKEKILKSEYVSVKIIIMKIMSMCGI